jgi:3-dehydroquinate synthase
VGLALDSCYAAEINLLTPSERDRILRGLLDAGLPIWTPLLTRRNPAGQLELLKGLTDFQEHLGGQLTLAMPSNIGNQTNIHEIAAERIESIIPRLEQWQRLHDSP